MVGLKPNGFTLVELAIVITITLVISGVVFLNLFNYRASQNLNLTLTEVMAVLSDTQKRAISQEGGQSWGARFINPGIGEDRYEVWSGSNYAAGKIEKTYGLSRGIKFGSPFSSSAIDLPFSALTGLLTENRIITLTASGQEKSVGDIILNNSGLIKSRIEKKVLAYWHLDDATSTIASDASGLMQDGRLFNSSDECFDENLNGGCPTWVGASECRAGSCISFDGSNDYIDTPFILNPAAEREFSAEIWVKPEPREGRDYFAILQQKGQNGRTWLYHKDDGRICSDLLFIIPNIPCANKIISLEQWTHIALVVDRDLNLTKLYLNGQLEKTGTNLVFPATGGMMIGRYRNANAGEEWPGLIDEVRIYNRALSDQEILNHYDDLK